MIPEWFRRCLALGLTCVITLIGLPPAAIAQPQQAPPSATDVTPDPKGAPAGAVRSRPAAARSG